MSRVKINLASGSVVEKPLVTCFKGTNGDYIVLDNETNGTMGYPIICISKINGNVVTKITDQSEWASVKENLKTIIAGTSLPYLSVADSLTAQEDFFTQLTLPVASFDLLKSVYVAPAASVESSVAETPAVETPAVELSAPVVDLPITPVVDIAPMTAESIAPAPVMPEVAPIEPSVPEVAPTIDPIAPAISEITTVEPNVPTVETPIMPSIEMPQMPVIEQSPVVNDVPISIGSNDDLASIKENFMKSCETMFDALVKKIENK